MQFDSLTPTRIAFGPGRLDELGKLTRPHGQRALVICGRTAMRRHGILDRAVRSLEASGVGAVVFDGVSPNPRSDELDTAVARSRREACDVVVGLGGGSALDAAKAIAVGVTAPSIGPLVGRAIPRTRGALPIVAVPTTAGTGSEVTSGAIVLDVARRFKSGIRGEDLFPRCALIDSELTATMPTPVLAETGFDALTHAIESYVARRASPITRAFSELAIALIAEHLPRAVRGESSPAVREAMSLAALLGGLNVAAASTCLPHRLQQAMGSVVEVPASHGRGLACLYPAWLRRIHPLATEPLSRVAGLLGGPPGPDAIVAFLERVGVRAPLDALGYRREHLPAFLENISGNLENDPLAQGGTPLIRAIYEESFAGAAVGT
jgi:alcohol dehydrogenase class IV